MRARSQVGWLGVMVALTFQASLTGCVVGADDSPDSTAPAATAPVPTAMDTILQQIDDSGDYAPEVALQAFSLAFAPLPGVPLPPADGSEVSSGTLAVRMLLTKWDRIDDEQRRTAQELVPGLLAGRQEENATAPPAADLAGSALRDPGRSLAAYQEILDQTFAFLLAKSTIADPGWRPSLEYGTHPKASAVAYTLTRPGGCTIRLVAARFDPREESIKRYTIGHEAFHCLESLVPETDSWSPWMYEGLATWAGSQVPTGPDGPLPSWYYYGFNSPDFWYSYFNSPQHSLYSRSYDAFGFFWLLTDHGADLWHQWARLPADDRSAFDALTKGNDAVNDWASGYFRDSSHDGWDMHGPGIPRIRPADLEDVVPVSNGTDEVFPVLEASVDFSRFSASADIVDIVMDGIGRTRLGDGSEPAVPAHSVTYCNRSDRCECPPGRSPVNGPLEFMPAGEFAVALSGGDRPGSFAVRGRSFDPETDCVPAPTGTWSLTSFSIAGQDFSADYTAVTGEAQVQIAPAGTAVMAIDADFDAELRFGEEGQTVPLHVTGVSRATMQFDTKAARLHWLSGPDDASYVITVQGRDVSNDELGGQGAFEPAALMAYEITAKTMTWTYAADGGTATWTWHR